jgi:uncharacterized protein
MTLTKPDNIRVDLPLEQIVQVCRKYDVVELEIFGSALRDDLRPDSDIDFLVVFRNDDAGPWMGKYTDMEQELTSLLGRRVDVVSRRAVEQSDNYLRRRHILRTARLVYAA